MRLMQLICRWTGKVSICSRIMIANSLVILVAVFLSAWLTNSLNRLMAQSYLIAVAILSTAAISTLLSYFFIKKALQPLSELKDFATGINNLAEIPPEVNLTHPDSDTLQVFTCMHNLIHQLETSNHQLHLISERAINAQEDERRRIARWLHDDTGQVLLSLILNLEQLGKKLPGDYGEIKEKIMETTGLARQTFDGLRDIIYGLRPSILDDLGLGPAIRWYANSKLEEAGITSIVKIHEVNLEISQQFQTSLFRIAQDAINNIVHHSQARNATIKFDIVGEEICLSFEDDGCGFHPPKDSAEMVSLHQWGLVGIQERVELMGGSYTLTTDPGKGTLLQVHAPVKKPVEVQYETN